MKKRLIRREIHVEVPFRSIDEGTFRLLVSRHGSFLGVDYAAVPLDTPVACLHCCHWFVWREVLFSWSWDADILLGCPNAGLLDGTVGVPVTDIVPVWTCDGTPLDWRFGVKDWQSPDKGLGEV
jgi:hypothetical protein